MAALLISCACSATHPAAHVELTDQSTDTGVAITLLENATGVVNLEAGFGAEPSLRGGQIGITVDGQDILQPTRAGGSVEQAWALLRAKLERSGFAVEEVEVPTLDNLRRLWIIRKA